MDLTRNTYYINPKIQKRIANVKILLAGAGLGSNIAECLVRIGCNFITIIDYDRVTSKSCVCGQN